MATTNENDWLGNLLMAWIVSIIGGIISPIGWLMVLFGTPEWWYETVVGFEMFPPEFTDYDDTFGDV